MSHDLSILTSICDRVMVMYMGQRMEIARSADIVESPQHPYTQALVAAVPVPDPALSPAADPDQERLGASGGSRAGLPVRAALPLRYRRLRPRRASTPLVRTGALGRLSRRTHRCAAERYRSAIVDTRRLDREDAMKKSPIRSTANAGLTRRAKDLHRKALVIDSEGVGVLLPSVHLPPPEHNGIPFLDQRAQQG